MKQTEYQSEWVLSSGSPSSSPILSPGNLNLSPSSACPVEATMARVVDAIFKSNMSYALDALIQFRACIYSNKPLSTVIRTGRSTPDSRRSPANLSTTTTTHHSSGSNPVTMTSCAQRSACTDSHQCAWCLEGSLYRELLFLTLTALSPRNIDLVHFDDAYAAGFLGYRTKDNKLVYESDAPPNYVAAACRQMLRPLTLVP
ncbi:uncharacterized protein DEA37_0002001 [Paragonimus westermani]|uniref:Uncharacterized protein n=1 Tax=Paragonimus westermani TaxID=34504 RepID=A0A5J4NL99_9TREM|nr:uncharacterized protein DEA37_0002001 [Paragonimus westermani]